MSMPYYVSPEQLMADKAEFARKGISRGRSIVVVEYAGGVLMIAENTTELSKLGEIYDRIGFAGVGKFSEFDQLRKIGVRYADMKGYSYSRDDVRGKALANAYSQAMGDVCTRELKPLEVEVIVVEVGDPTVTGHEKNTIYRIRFDGSISDHENFCVIGGSAEELVTFLEEEYKSGLPLGEAVRLGRKTLSRAADGQTSVPPANLEVCVLEEARTGRKFRRLSTDQVGAELGA